jgi:NADH-quinone oxidoreductase subunit C
MGTINDQEKPQWLLDLETRFSAVIKTVRKASPDEYEVFVEAGPHVEVLKFLKTYSLGAFEHLADLTAYDEMPKTPRFHVIYELISMGLKTRARIVALCLDDQNPVVESIVDLWPGANWLERETYDMFGIHFKGHPDLRRMLLPQSFVGFPLRKDFIVDYRQSFPHSLGDETAFDPFGNTVIQSEGMD